MPIEGVYPSLEFPAPPDGRPYVLINMVATIDGKIVSGTREEHVQDIGSDIDHATMRQIESCADAVLIGAGSLRATKGLHYGPRLLRIVATNSADLPYDSRFFTENIEGAYVAGPVTIRGRVPEGVKTLTFGGQELDWAALLAHLRSVLGVDRLLVEGGSEINAALLRLGLVDELFLTVAPLVKLGADTPTYADGTALGRGEMARFSLVSSIAVADEVFLRYRRHR